MDQIYFQSRTSLVEDYQVLDIFINQTKLVHLLRVIEYPKLKKEGRTALAGAYEGLPPLMVLPPSRHFFGQAHEAYSYKSRVAILEYGYSGVPGDWTFAVEIVMGENQIVWRNPGNVQRPHWDYSDLGVFTFDKLQYQEALMLAKQDQTHN